MLTATLLVVLVLPVLEWQWFGVLEGLAVTELLDPARHVGFPYW